MKALNRGTEANDKQCLTTKAQRTRSWGNDEVVMTNDELMIGGAWYWGLRTAGFRSYLISVHMYR
jgi:hypothetical protein